MLRLAIAAAALLLIAATALQAEPAHGIALYGAPKAAARLHALPLRQRGRAKGRSPHDERLWLLRQHSIR